MLSLSLSLSLSLRFYGHFPGGPGSADARTSPFWILFKLRVMEVVLITGAIKHVQSSSQNVTTNNTTPSSFYSVICTETVLCILR